MPSASAFCCCCCCSHVSHLIRSTRVLQLPKLVSIKDENFFFIYLEHTRANCSFRLMGQFIPIQSAGFNRFDIRFKLFYDTLFYCWRLFNILYLKLILFQTNNWSFLNNLNLFIGYSYFVVLIWDIYIAIFVVLYVQQEKKDEICFLCNYGSNG